MDKTIKYNCIFGGGGIRGLCYIGAINAIDEMGIELEDIGGSSVGAVFAALYAVGYTMDEIKNFFHDFNFNMFRDINIGLFSNSISKGEIFLEWLREKIEKKHFGKNYSQGGKKVRFKDLDKDLYILTLDINTNTPFVFSKDSTPDEEVAFAVRTSASLPGLMQPITFGDSILVDGDLIKSWPAWKVFEKFNTSENRLLEFRLEGSRESLEIKNPMDFASSILNTIWYLSTENVYQNNYKNDRYDYIVIDTKDVIMFDFTISREEKDKLIEKGYQTTKKFLLETLVEKKKEILPKYKKYLLDLQLLQKAMNKSDVKEVLYIINEMLASMLDDNLYIDISFSEKMRDLKESIIINTKKQFMFKPIIDNDKQIKERIEYLKMLIEEKVSELSSYIDNFTK